MERFKSLRKSEKNLIYVLALLVILLIYSKFFRNPSIEHQAIEERHIDTSFVYENQDENLEKLEDNNEEISTGQIYQYESNPNYQRTRSQAESFGKKINLLALAEENNLEVNRYDVKPIKEAKIEDLDYYYIDSSIEISGDRSNIDSFLSAINSIKDLYIENVEMKFNGENTDFNLTLREYSLEKVVFQTPEIAYSNSNNNLIYNPPIYNFPEYRPSIDPNSRIVVEQPQNNTEEEQTFVFEDNKEEVRVEETVNTNEEAKTEENPPVENTTKPNFSRVDAVNKLSKSGGRHLVTSKYVEDNYSLLKGKSNVNSFNDPNYIGDFEFVFLGNLSLASSPLYLVNGEKNVGVSVYGGNNVTIYLKDNAGNEVFLTQTKSGSGYENIKFELPSDLSYPVKITSINVSGGGGSNAKAKNFVAF